MYSNCDKTIMLTHSARSMSSGGLNAGRRVRHCPWGALRMWIFDGFFVEGSAPPRRLKRLNRGWTWTWFLIDDFWGALQLVVSGGDFHLGGDINVSTEQSIFAP